MQYFRFDDLKERGIVRSRTTLARWQRGLGFPRPKKITCNSALFSVEEVEKWLAERTEKA